MVQVASAYLPPQRRRTVLGTTPNPFDSQRYLFDHQLITQNLYFNKNLKFRQLFEHTDAIKWIIIILLLLIISYYHK